MNLQNHKYESAEYDYESAYCRLRHLYDKSGSTQIHSADSDFPQIRNPILQIATSPQICHNKSIETPSNSKRAT
jgi:hypothetical protein